MLFFIFTVAFLVILFIVLKTFIIIPMREVGIKERLGKFNARLDPGFHFLIPFVDQVSYKHEMREQVLEVV